MQYPPASVEKAVQGIFLEGATDQSAWHAKLALLAYYLLDAGLVNDAGELMYVLYMLATERMSIPKYPLHRACMPNGDFTSCQSSTLAFQSVSLHYLLMLKLSLIKLLKVHQKLLQTTNIPLDHSVVVKRRTAFRKNEALCSRSLSHQCLVQHVS